MPAAIIPFPIPEPNSANQIDMEAFFAALPLSFSADHCQSARLMLNWSIEALAFRSGVSPAAIRRIEKGANLRSVTLQALAYAFEAEGMVFFPNHPPMLGENCRGATSDPRLRPDFHLVE